MKHFDTFDEIFKYCIEVMNNLYDDSSKTKDIVENYAELKQDRLSKIYFARNDCKYLIGFLTAIEQFKERDFLNEQEKEYSKVQRILDFIESME